MIFEKSVESIKNKLPHAIIIEGESIFTDAFAMELIKAVFCKNSDFYCGKCATCRKISKNIHPDLSIVFAKNQKSISIDCIREIKQSINIYPNEADYKIYFIKNADDMTIQAQNSLLKVLEQPPKFAVFILSTDKQKKLLDTIVSRCVCFRAEHFGRFEQKDRDIKGLDKTKNLCVEFLNRLCFYNEFEYYKFYNEFFKNKNHIKDILDMLICLLRDVLIYKSYCKNKLEFYKDQEKEIKKLASELETKKIIKIMDIAENTKEEVLQNANFNACISAFQIRIWEEKHG